MVVPPQAWGCRKREARRGRNHLQYLFWPTWAAVPRVGMCYTSEDALQGVSKLHCFRWGRTNSFSIHIGESVVNNEARTSVPLGDHTQRRHAEIVRGPYR